MAGTSRLKVSGDKGHGTALAQKLCCGSDAVSSRYARRDLRYAFTEHLHGVNVCLILDQFGEFITCPIQEGDGAKKRWLNKKLYRQRYKVENYFCRLKGWASASTRCDKLAYHFLVLIQFASVIDWLRHGC
jgi:transposase